MLPKGRVKGTKSRRVLHLKFAAHIDHRTRTTMSPINSHETAVSSSGKSELMQVQCTETLALAYPWSSSSAQPIIHILRISSHGSFM